MENIMFYDENRWLWFQLLLMYAEGISTLDKKKIQTDFIWMLETHPVLNSPMNRKISKASKTAW